MKTKRPLPKRFSGKQRVSGILVGLLALALVAASPASAAPFAYVSNLSSNTVSVIGTEPGSVCLQAGQSPPCVVAVLPVGEQPIGVAVNPAGTRAYVANSNLFQNGMPSFSVIDTTTTPPSVSGPFLGLGFQPWGVAVNVDGTRVYVANGDGTVAVINASVSPPVVMSTVPMGKLQDDGTVTGALNGIAVAGSRIWVTDFANGTVNVKDPNSLAAPVSIPVGSSPLGIAVNSSGTRVYVSYGKRDPSNDEFDLEVALIDPATNSVVRTVPVGTVGINSGNMPAGLAVKPSSGGSADQVYVAVSAENTVDVIDTAPGAVCLGGQVAPCVVARISVGADPFGVGFDRSGARLLVGNSDDGTMSVINPTSNTVTSKVSIGGSSLVFGLFFGELLANEPPPPDPQPQPTCDGTIAELQKKVSKLGRHHGPAWLKAALYARGAAEYELKLAYKKVGDKDSRYLRAMKEFKNGDAKLCAGRYWRAKHEYWDAFDIAHRILRNHRHGRR